MVRRNFIRDLGLGVAATFITGRSFGKSVTNSNNINMENYQTLEFPALPFAYDALEPYIDAKTMEIHYDRHHRAYFNNYVNAVKGTPLENLPLEKVFASVSTAGDAVRNNGGGFYNHILFWNNLGKGSSGPSDELSSVINQAFGSFDKFREIFNSAGKTRFGSGWAWLSVMGGKLLVHSTANQDSPVSEGAVPVVGIDVWEHAYYLKHQNRRQEYLDSFWNVLDWSRAAANFAAATA